MSAVIGIGLERLGGVVGDEQGHTARAAMHESGLHRSPEVRLGRHVVDGIVHEDRIKRAAEAHLAHVTLEVFALGVDRSGSAEHGG